MAERRMLTKKVTDDDNFMSLSSSAQALYLHLSMSADDDGFCNQVSISMFKAHASVQDLQALLEKRYIYQFDNGVIVIKHWRMANALRKDRYTPTAFQEELAKLDLKSNGAYTLVSDGCQMVAKRLPQDRVDKDSIEKISIGEVKESPKIDYQQIIDLFNTICKSFPSVRSLSDARKKAIKARLNTYAVDDFKQCFENAEASSFLKGGNQRNWTATFDWLIKDQNMAKVLDGNYNDKGTTGMCSSFDSDEFIEAALSRDWGDAPEYIADNPELQAEADKLKKELSEKY